MKRVLYLVLLLVISSASVGQQLAFPEAVGFGRYAVGGRDGTVYRVTNLNDSGAGSLRDAISQPNRIVIFDVAGVININSRLAFSSNLTVAGQTAPGEGIVVYGNGVTFSGAHNVIVRHMAFRMGVNGDGGKDAAGIANGSNMIFDHVSFSWGRDETFSINWDNKGTEPSDITIQNSIIGQGLLGHSAGGLMQTDGGVTLYRNLYIDNHTRNPKVKGLNQFVNNVVYNWGGGGCYILGDSEGTSWATIVNNYFINGPNGSSSPYSRANNNFQLFAEGNYHDSNKNGSLDGTLSVKSDYGPVFWVESPDYWEGIDDSNSKKIPKMHPEIPDQMTAEEAYYWIVDNVGKVLPARDEVDKYLIEELTSLGTIGTIISSEKELPTNGPGRIFSGPLLADSDNDGIPDIYEEILGTDSSVDDAMVIGEDGYTNIERYINSISAPMPFLRNPVGIVASALTTSSITIGWDNLETQAHEVIVEISSDKTNFSEIGRVAQSVTSYKADELESGTTYYFRLKAVGGSIESAYSDVFTRATNEEATVPKATINPTPSHNEIDVPYRNLTLSWENSTGIMGGAVYFDLYFGTSSDDMQLVSERKGAKSYLLESIEPNTTYYWQIKAENVLGESLSEIWSFTSAQVVERELLLHIPFDEIAGNTAIDNVSNTLATAVEFTPQWMDGKVDNSIYFSGTASSYMRFPHNDGIELDDQSFSIALWFKSPGNIADSYFLHKGMHDEVFGGNGKWIGLQYKNERLTFAVDDDIVKSNLDISGAKKWFDNKWHHVVCVRDREEEKLLVYIDGLEVGSRTDLTTQGIGVTTDLIIGNCDGYFNTPYPGNLDDLRIYGSALTSHEVYDLYESPATSIVKPIMEEKTVSASPNPFHDYLVLQLNHEAVNYNIAKVEIYDLLGKKIVDKNSEINNVQIEINGLNFLPQGIYTCIVRINNQVFTTKVIR